MADSDSTLQTSRLLRFLGRRSVMQQRFLRRHDSLLSVLSEN